jgi:putative transposase
VVRVLDRLAGERPLPTQLVLDNGPERISRVLAAWAQQHAVSLRFIDPGKPMPNAHGESFHGRLRDACRNEHWVLGLGDARQIVAAWRQDDHQARPHSALGYQTPEEFRRAGAETAITRQVGGGLS